jgi:hypothetical protein
MSGWPRLRGMCFASRLCEVGQLTITNGVMVPAHGPMIQKVLTDAMASCRVAHSVWATSHASQPPSVAPRSMTGSCSASHSTDPPPTYTEMAKVQLSSKSVQFVVRELVRIRRR